MKLSRQTNFDIFLSGSIRIFICYSRKDVFAREIIEEHIENYGKKRGIRAWSDQGIPLGEDWEKNILEAIRISNCSFILISQNWLGSDYIRDKELPPIIERHQNEGDSYRVLPIIIDDTKPGEVAQFQALQISSAPIEAAKKSISINFLSDINSFLDDLKFANKTSCSRRFFNRFLYIVLFFSILLWGIDLNSIVEKNLSFSNIDQDVGFQEFTSFMNNYPGQNKPFRTKLFRSNKSGRFYIHPNELMNKTPVLSTERYITVAIPDEKRLTGPIFPNETVVITAQEDLEVSTDYETILSQPSGLKIMTEGEYNDKKMLVAMITSGFVFLLSFLLFTIKIRAVEDQRLMSYN